MDSTGIFKYFLKTTYVGNLGKRDSFFYSDTLLWSHVLLGKSDHWQNPPIWSETSKTMGANCPQDGPHFGSNQENIV